MVITRLAPAATEGWLSVSDPVLLLVCLFYPAWHSHNMA